MSDNDKEHLLKFLNKKIRFDGRKFDQFRDVNIEYDISANAEGSAKIQIGETVVVAGVKMLVGAPFPDRPDEGAIMVNAELLPLSSPDFESGPPSIDAIELARVVDRGIRESKAVDLKKLCIKKGETCWIVSIDICTLNVAGNLFDASTLAAMAALTKAKFPKYEDGTVDYKEHTDKGLDLEKVPIGVTVLKIGDALLVDPLNEEEIHLDARLTIPSTKDGTICALQKGGSETLSLDDIKSMVELALKKSSELRKKL